jgi:hypothetical protein
VPATTTTSHQARKGNSYQRRARRAWLLTPAAGFGGDGTTAPCAHCFTLVTDATMDVDRIECGGSYHRDNIQPACVACNRSRQNNRNGWTPPRLALAGRLALAA